MSFSYVKNPEGSFSIVPEAPDDDAPIISGSPEHSSLPRLKPLSASIAASGISSTSQSFLSASGASSSANSSLMQFISVLRPNPPISSSLLVPCLVPIAPNPPISNASDPIIVPEDDEREDEQTTSSEKNREKVIGVYGKRRSAAMTGQERSRKFRDRQKKVKPGTPKGLQNSQEKIAVKKANKPPKRNDSITPSHEVWKRHALTQQDTLKKRMCIRLQNQLNPAKNATKREVLIRAPHGTPMAKVAKTVIEKLEQRDGFGKLFSTSGPIEPLEKDPLATDTEVTPQASVPVVKPALKQMTGSVSSNSARPNQRTNVQATRSVLGVSGSVSKKTPVQISNPLPSISVRPNEGTPIQVTGVAAGLVISGTPVEKPRSRRVCLRWNSYHSNMQHSFPSLLDSEEFVDVTLACEGRSLKCHKMILSSCSDYLAQLLRENPCQHPIILMKDLKFWEIEALVKFMYRGEVNVTHDKLPQLLNAAEALQVKGLAGPSNTPPKPSQALPPHLIPQTKNPAPQPAPTRSAPNAPKDVPMMTSGGQSILKRGQKRPIATSDVPDARPLMKIRLQRPTSPQNSSETVVKSEPIDPPLSPGDAIYHRRLELDHATEDDDSLDPSNLENAMAMYEDDDPGGNDSELANASEQDNEEMKNSFTDDHMEVVPTDFLDQVQNIDEDPGGRNTSKNSQPSEQSSKRSTEDEAAKDEEPRKQTQQRQSTSPQQRQSTSAQQKEQQKQQKEQGSEIEPNVDSEDKQIRRVPVRRRRRGLGFRSGRGGKRKMTNGSLALSPNSKDDVPDEDSEQSLQEPADESINFNHEPDEVVNNDVPITDLSSDTQSPFEGFTLEDIERAVRFIRKEEIDCEESEEENGSE